MELDLAILGGGWAGCLYALKALNDGTRNIGIIDQSQPDRLGGLLKSETIDGFTFDTGGPHLLFSKDNEVLNDIVQLLNKNFSKRERNNYVFYNSTYIPYPFENGIYLLPPKVRAAFVKDIVERMIFIAKNKDWKPGNFLEWITGFFGEKMANEYLIPYNEKIWKRPLDKMEADWVFTPGRLPFPEIENLILSAAGIPNIGYKEQAYFFYPIKGGISSLFQSLLDNVTNKGANIIDNEMIKSVRQLSNSTYIINSKIKSKKVISTIPLPELLVSLSESGSYKSLANRFDYNSVVIVGVALRGRTPNQTSVYVPDPKIVFHRYTWMSSLVKPNNENNSNLIAEVTIPKGKDIDLTGTVKRVIKGLIDMDIIEDQDSVLFTKTWFNHYGYPIYSEDHNAIRKEAMDIIKDHGIKSVGRWGSWHYWNTDMVYKAINELYEAEGR